MSLRCQAEMNWYEVGKETPREHILLFLVTEAEPETLYTGVYTDGGFRLSGQQCAVLPLAGTKFTHFAYVNSNMLPKNCKEGCEGSGWHVTKDSVPDNDEPVAIYPSFQGHQFAVWNKHEQCWDDESGDDYLCNKEEVDKWYPINWGGVL